MHKVLTGAIVALGLTGASLAFALPADAQPVGISINVGDVAFGYQDGYWDRAHMWHRWRNDAEMQYYIAAPGSQYNAWRHDRDADMGWRSGVVFNVNDVAFGYRDGYWDHGHQWHVWRNDEEMRNYRNAPGNRYNDWQHERDADHGWHS